MKKFLDLNLTVRGTVAKGTENEIIFQKGPFGQFAYKGPKLPSNPQTNFQQSNRMKLKAANDAIKDFDDDEKQYVKDALEKSDVKLHWHQYIVSQIHSAMKDLGAPYYDSAGYDEIKYGNQVHGYNLAHYNKTYYG